jgi:multiple sugar transport system permease protein
MGTSMRNTTTSTSARPKKPGWRRKDIYTAWAFSTPALMLLLIFLIIPFFVAIYYSLTNARLVSGPLHTKFVELSNYIQMLGDSSLHQALLNNSVFGIIMVPVQTSVALFLAVLVNQKLRGMAVFRTIYFSPVVTPLVVVAVVWSFLYNPGQGLINEFLHAISFGHLGPYNWLSNPELALPAIMLLSIWQGVGFQMVVYLAGLRGIPESLYEAARIDGAGRWQQFWHISLPQLRNIIIFVLIATTILSFKLYTQVEVMTQGGPENATSTAVWYIIHQSIHNVRVGYPSAIAVIFFLILLIRVIPIMRSVNKTVEREL